MRTKKTVLNSVMNLVEELVAIICAFVLPKLILSNFGSVYNGITTSISQFLACAVLLRAGLGGATQAALYKPLANNDKDKINSIMSATNKYMKRIGIILAILIVCFAAIYPLIVNSQFSWLFSFSLFIIIGVSTFFESFFGITYLILLQADQKNYMLSIFRILSYFINLIIVVILVMTNQSIHIVKLGSALAFVIYPLALRMYVKKKYQLNLKVQPDNKAISQRWHSFWHQVAIFINNNTDVIVLSVFTDMLEVSVYSVYNLVIGGLRRFVTAFTRGIDAAFGNMLAKNEKTLLKENLSIVEFIIYNLSTVIYACAILLVMHFVKIYTLGITDVDYLRPMFAYILLAAQFFYAIRLPYSSLVNAAGKYKETKKYAIMEVVINVSVSVILVIKFGLVGVAIGTFIALVYKTFSFSNYVFNNIVERDKKITYYKCFLSIVEFAIIVLIVKWINLPTNPNYICWIVNALIVMAISIIVISIGVCIFYRKDFKRTIQKLKNLRKRKVKKIDDKE